LLAGIAVRVVALLIARGATGLPVEQLALYFDGHEYITIAQSFPLPYGPDLWLETNWLPGYPLAIAIAFQVVGNYAVAALLVSILASAATAPLLFALARGRPGAVPAAMLLTVGPTMWLTASSLAHSESLFVPLVLATVLLGRRGYFSAALATGVLAAATRHAGLLLTPILLVQCWERGERRPLPLAACALPALVLPLLNLYLHARIPGYPGLLSGMTKVVYGANTLDIPFRSLLQGRAWAALDRWEAVLNILSLVAVVVGMLDALWQRDFDLAVWAGAFLALVVSLKGSWAFPSIGRFLLPALPVALLALARLRLSRPVVAAICASLLVISLGDVSLRVRKAVALEDGFPALAWHISSVARTLHGGGPVGLRNWTAQSQGNEP
jgi:hypothetical protein